VTTASLEALKAYNAGYRAMIVNEDMPTAAVQFQQAAELDPKFAMAYARLGTSEMNMGEPEKAAEATAKAFELKDRVSEKEKLYITSHYDGIVTGDHERAKKTFELWEQMYPRDKTPPANLSTALWTAGSEPESSGAGGFGNEGSARRGAELRQCCQQLSDGERFCGSET